MTDVNNLMSPLLNQDLDIGSDSNNNQNLKDAFAKAHEKVDEFFDTDLAKSYNMDTSPEIATGYIPFFPPAESAAITGQVLKTFKTIEQESALADELSLSAKEIARIEDQVIDSKISGIAKETLVNEKTTLFENNLSHIFRDAPGHLSDTPFNRQLLVDAASNPKNYLGTDKFGNKWQGYIQKDGTQVWVSLRNGEIRNGGINKVPKNFDSETGLCDNIKN